MMQSCQHTSTPNTPESKRKHPGAASTPLFGPQVYALLATWNLTEGPSGVFDIHRYKSMRFRTSKNMMLVQLCARVGWPNASELGVYASQQQR